ncbi:MAG: hypothetical protein F6K48_19420, partial [Okeania sp. SIO3H1]|nr:hypothetical protein [Okeania sp. SIO3H1]
RHRCAHPVLDSEGLLFQPTPELARTHIRTAIEVLLSQPPIIGKAAREALEKDVEGLYFPDDLEGVKKSLSRRHFLVGSEKYLANIILLSLKKVLYLELPTPNLSLIKKYLLVIECLVKDYRNRNIFESLERAKLRDILEKTNDDRLQHLAVLFSIDDRFWDDCPEHITEKFKLFLKEQENLIDYGFLLFHVSPEIKDELLEIFHYYPLYHKKRENSDFIIKVRRAISNRKECAIFAREIVKRNINIFIDSPSYASGRQNAKENIRPMIPIMTDEDIKYLLEQIIEKQRGNCQLIDCIFILKELFQETIYLYPETLPFWENFYESIIYKNAWSGIEELKQLIDNCPQLKQVETETF